MEDYHGRDPGNPCWQGQHRYRGDPNAGSASYLGGKSWGGWVRSDNLNPFRRAEVDIMMHQGTHTPPADNPGCSKNWYGLWAATHQVTKISDPAEIILRSEQYPAFGAEINSPSRGRNRRHIGAEGVPEGGNILFADGHAGWGDQWGPPGYPGGWGSVPPASFPSRNWTQVHEQSPIAIKDKQPDW
jgi:prepilin-type processing-associated H-X9-DG protein